MHLMYSSRMQHLEPTSDFDITSKSSGVVKYGWTAIGVMELILIAVIFLPNGAYVLGRSSININSLSSPFVDYGSVEVTVATVAVALLILARVRHWKEARRSAWVLVLTFAGVLGSLLPDAWSRNTLSILKGDVRETVGIHLQYGFWLNLALVAAILTLSMKMLCSTPRQEK